MFIGDDKGTPSSLVRRLTDTLHIVRASGLKSPRGADQGLYFLHPMKILVVDDDPGIVTMLSDWLKEMGHESVGITRGAHTTSWLQSGRFDLVLMDIQMPDSDGVMMISDIVNAGMNVVVMSGLPEDLWVAKAMMEGAYDCLPKPISMKKLELILERLSPQTHK
jgi:DNA-binding NtrC family response regulator